jgi:formate transporter
MKDTGEDIFEVTKAVELTSYRTPKQTLLVVIKAGIAKGLLLSWQTILLGWHAGIFISLGGGLTVMVNGNLQTASIDGTVNGESVDLELSIPTGIRKILGGCLFPLGLVMVILSGAELFTGNIMYLAAAKMGKKTSWSHLTANWILSYFSNLAGSLATAYFLFHKAELLYDEDVFPTAAQSYLFKTAEDKTSLEMWWAYFLRAIACNILVIIIINKSR